MNSSWLIPIMFLLCVDLRKSLQDSESSGMLEPRGVKTDNCCSFSSPQTLETDTFRSAQHLSGIPKWFSQSQPFQISRSLTCTFSSSYPFQICCGLLRPHPKMPQCISQTRRAVLGRRANGACASSAVAQVGLLHTAIHFFQGQAQLFCIV